MLFKRTQTLFSFLIFVSLFFLTGFLLSGCQNGKDGIAVFVPGVVAGSPTYEMMVEGVTKAVKEHGVEDKLSVIEGGFNQGEWKDKVTALANSGEFELIITSNPAMPQICAEVSASAPNQKFLILDGHLEGNKSIYTFRFNQMEQAYLAGYFGGLVSSSSMEYSKESMKAGLIAGQEYPDMNQAIRPGFEFGFLDAVKGVDGASPVDFRVVGNWYDTEKGGDLATSIYDAGADVILTIAGGANMGVVSSAKEKGGYVLWFDSNGYSVAPGIVVGSTYIKVDKAAYEKTSLALNEELPFGQAETGNISDGWVDFVFEDENFTSFVPSDIQEKMKAKLEEFNSGKLSFPMPSIQ